MTVKNISKFIPPEAVVVDRLFKSAVTEETVVYTRRGCALLAVVCSSVNVIGFGIRMGAHVISAVI